MTTQSCFIKPLLLMAGLAIGASFITGTAQASSAPAKSADTHGAAKPGETEEEKAPDNSVIMPTLLLPAVVNGRLSHHIYISYRLVVGSQMQVDRVNQRIAWLHDAIMRSVYKGVRLDPANPNRPDREALIEQIVTLANKDLHGDIVETLFFMNMSSEKDSIQAPPLMPVGGAASGSKKKPSSGH